MATVQAFVNHGQWLVHCSGCESALTVACRLHDGECSECGASLLIAWPKDIADIETILVPRPPINRNWLPGETVEDLLAENAVNGVN